MDGVKRCYRLIIASSKCILNARTFSACSKLCTAASPYGSTARNGRMSVSANLFSQQLQTPFGLQCLNFSQESKARKIRRAIPDELWAILLVGVGGVCVFAASEYNKHKLGKKKPPELEFKLKMAKKKDIDGQKKESIVLLKEALKLIHEYLEANPEPLKEDEEDKGKVKTHRYLKYVLDQLANLSFELQKWSEAEHYFRLLLRNILSSGTPKDDNSVVEISLKLSIACAHQDKQDLALQGFMWSTDTMQKKINRSADTSEDSKALLGLCLEGWGTYLLCQDKPSQAADLLTRALIVSKEVLGEDHEQTAVILNNLAKACAESGKYELAEDMAREAIRIAEKTENSHHQRYMANLGAILNLKGNVLNAKEALLKALKMADDAKDEETKEMVNDSLTTLETNL